MSKREGGLDGGDPDVKAWLDEAAENRSALTEKQRRDRERVRGRYDMPRWLKEAVDEAADVYETSASQMAATLLAWALKDLNEGDGELRKVIEGNRALSRSLRFRYDLEIPSSLENATRNGPD